MFNINDLKQTRKQKVDSMNQIVESRGDNFDEESLAAVKTFKDEIAEIDRKIAAIEEIRATATKESRPVEVKKTDAQAEYRDAFNDYLRGDITKKELETRSMTVGTNGDEVVPEEFYRVLGEKIAEFGSLYNDIEIHTTANNGLMTIPFIDDTANTGAIVAEGGTIGLADATTSTVTLNAYKIGTGIKVSTELLEDSFFNVESYIAGALGKRLSRLIENLLLSGTGSNQPEGILVNADVVDVDTAAVGTVTVDDLLELPFEVQSSSRKGGVFYVSDDVIKVLALAKDDNGRPLLQPAASATQANGVQYTLGGYPVKVDESLAGIATGNVPVIFGNPNKMMGRVLRNVTVKRDETPADDMIAFYATMRFDAKLVDINDTFVKLTVQ